MRTPSHHPITTAALWKRLPFFLACDTLKAVERDNRIHARTRLERVAEHAWHATLLAMLYADAAPAATDHDRVRDLLVVHDVIDVFDPDTRQRDPDLPAAVADREGRGRVELTALLPEDSRPPIEALWQEFQAQTTVEAQFARAVDALHPVILSWAAGGYGRSDGSLTATTLIEAKRHLIGPYPRLWAVLFEVLHAAIDRGVLPDPDHVVPQPDIGDGGANQPCHDGGSRLAFFLATDRLKLVERANRLHCEPRLESAAEHTWHAQLLALLFADAAPPEVDHAHVGTLLVIHDLVEVYAGDTPLWNAALQATEAVREQDAARRLLAHLPRGERPRFGRLIDEFQVQRTPEARFARAIDSLHPLLVSWTEGGFGHPEHHFTPSWLVERKRPTLGAYPALWQLALEIWQGAVDRGVLAADALMAPRM